MSDNIKIKIDGSVAVVTMAKPPHNLINGNFLQELISAFESAETQGARSILLRSEMKHFSAGADIDGFGSGTNRDMAADEVLGRLEAITLPTIAAVHGLALGGGFELALTCDFIIAAKSASLGLVETSLGLAPLLGGVQRVVQRSGTARGKEIAMFGRRHDPATLASWGVINVVVEEEELLTASMSWARQLASGPTVAHRVIKKLAAVSANEGVHSADLIQDELVQDIWKSEDAKAGLEAYAESGPGTAIFEGR
ncbi:MAG: enoyl-CoA hydratase/isomerase family protein [Actinomycetota bacterium]|nr:enoyl-CoA hydratase/isomerase family protein [Actinomycetota bacterium]